MVNTQLDLSELKEVKNMMTAFSMSCVLFASVEIGLTAFRIFWRKS